MDGAHLHLLLTHVPVLGTVFGLLLLAYAVWRKHTDLTKVSLGVFVITGLLAGVVYLTGEAAEEAVEGLPGVSAAAIEVHEAAALYALVATGALGVAALAGLTLFYKVRIPRWFTTMAILLALAASGVMAWTANLGGQINHPEIRSVQTSTQPGEAEPGLQAEEQEEHEAD